MLTPQPFELIALAAVLADAVTTYLGLRAGLREANPLLRFCARLGGLRLPWAPGVVMLGLAAWQHSVNWSQFVSDDRQRLGWMVAAALHAVAAVVNVRSIAKG